MPNKMLIDASHPEETRVIVLRGNRVEEFDFESADRRQLRGNIYLAKVTRVEPSLQAAFVEYGGNRHGFLAFSEIHPDYYQIPVADRQALLEEEARVERAAEDDDQRPSSGRDRGRGRGRRRHSEAAKRRDDESVSETAEAADTEHANPHPSDGDHQHSAAEAETPAPAEASSHAAIVDVAVVQAPEAHPAEPASHRHSGARQPAPHGEPVAHVETPSEPIADGSGLETAPSPAPEVEASAAHAAAGEQPAVSHETEAGHSSAEGEASLDPVHVDADAATALEGDAGVHHEEAAAVEARRQTEEDEHAETDDDEDEQDDDEDDDDEDDEEADGEPHVEQLGGDAMEEVPSRPLRSRRHYKIQEVIKRRQVLLVQVVKEERGTKGAALTTYLSLAGRYSVLMPNTARGGGISRKITDSADRKRLESIAEELEVPEGMGIILRTAGASRTKPEVKRDFEYLLRMWETVREVTLKSSAPTLVYEEGSLIKRAIRDLYNKDVEEVLVAGDDGYREAKEFMRLLMPSHAKNVQPYREAQPIFAFAGAETQLDGMYFNQVTLRSGGYIVINQTEALVAIDVNSGRSTREHNIEDTALRTNLEAADEVARQLRLRDLAGLIVVDFIDMEEGRNNRAVERRMKDALKNDRARIQIGRISHFGLLEMSRQRIRTGVVEGSTVPCAHCMGSGMVRSTSSIALHVLRGLEEALIKNPSYDVTIRTRTEVALYILNQKRAHLRELEERFRLTITLAADPSLSGVTYFAIERGELATHRVEARPAGDLVRIDSVRPIYDDEASEAEASEAEDAEGEESDGEEEVRGETDDTGSGRDADSGEDGDRDDDGRGRGRGRGRRRRRGGRDRNDQAAPAPDAPQPSDDGLAVVMEISGDRPRPRRERAADDAEGEEAFEGGEVDAQGEPIGRGRSTTRRRRRSRRGGENRRPFSRERSDEPGSEEAANDDGHAAEAVSDAEEAVLASDTAQTAVPAAVGPATAESWHADEPRPLDVHPLFDESALPPSDSAPETSVPPRDGDGTPVAVPAAASPEPGDDAHAADHAAPEAAAATKRADLDAAPEVPDEEEASRPKRSGWWQRAKATFGG